MDCARNIITANFSGGGTSATTAPLWQWDYGQVLCITGIDLPAAFEVHFSTNRTGGASTVAVGADGQVTIPSVLLTIGKNLNAWIYLSDSEGEGETEYSILIPVKARPMPETYDAEVSGEFDDVVRQVSEYAQTAQTAADNAGASASAAAASADSAAASASAAESAKTAAETAQGEAEDAQSAAETAAQTATEKAQQSAQDAAQAAQSKADAESAAGRAEAAETGAESAKTDAETAAQGAADSASAASASATSAGQAASAAAGSASAAVQSAASIEGDVQIASQKAAEAQTAADQAVAAKDSAQTAQTAAETAATNAGQSASTATAKAAEAAQSASGAAQSKTDAEAAAARAEQAAASLTVDSALSETSENPVQNKVITGEVTQLKSHLEDIIDIRNLFWDAKFVRDKYYYGTAVTQETLGYFVVPVTNGQTYTFGCNVRFLSSATAGIDNTEHAARYQYTPDFSGDLYVTVRLAQADQYAMCLSTVDIAEVGTTEAPRLAQHLLAQESGDSVSLAMSQVGVGNAIASTAVVLNGEGQVTPENIEGVTVIGGNVLDDAERIYCSQQNNVGQDGYVTVNSTGAFVQNTASFCTFLVKLKTNSTYTASHSIMFMALLRSNTTSGTSPVTYTDVIGELQRNVTTFESGDAKYALLSWNYDTYPIDESVISRGTVARAEKTINLPDWWFGGEPEPEAVKPKYLSITGDMSDGEFLALMGYKQNLRKGERYVFSGNVGTISSLHFGFTYANTFSASNKITNEFTIDATNVTYKKQSTDANYTYQYAHGLTLTNNLQFIFEYLPEGNAKITLISNGMMFAQTLPFVKQTISQVVALSSGSTLTDCKLTWTPIDIDKAIWMFGDSYFAYSAARWVYYLQQYGYAENALLDGFPGEGSVNARNSLMTLIQFGTPKYIVWCMGMNDGSDTDASTPNSDWTVRRDEMLTICNANGITPIFATIPNVPSILHTGKNAWIKASGYRYIDFAAAVGAESAGSTWFSGMLSSDNVHPSESGAKALFARALVDFPEIMLND